MKDHHHFTLVVSYGPNIGTPELLLIINKTVIAINIFTDVVRVGDSVHSKLPVEIEDTFIHRDFDIVTVDSAAGFILECNTKFHICTFEVSGWYFGKTAGLFGTINNEASDDFLSSDKKKYNETNIKDFAALPRSCRTQANCTVIKGTTCLGGYCLCGDNTNPVNGACKTQIKDVTPQHVSSACS
ncbi:hypothetical protein WA026_021100 [Henosepilachna vigintioctopunctata]|uniref:VWFD domain-containing protein n=1 Tax=Henosepilachna vigintioctopunctata TaxID=420089 RepID=A0AAW1V5W0_9CUCU